MSVENNKTPPLSLRDEITGLQANSQNVKKVNTLTSIFLTNRKYTVHLVNFSFSLLPNEDKLNLFIIILKHTSFK